MIYLLYGNNHESIRAKVRAIVDAQLKKKPDALYFRVNEENWKDTDIIELTQSQGLFSEKYIVVFDHLLRDKDAGEVLLAHTKDLSSSVHIFVFSEGDLTKEILKKVEKHAEKVQEVSLAEKKEKPKFNVFAMADALGTKNKKELWTLYQKALFAGVTAEEIHPILAWQTKAMLAALRADSAAEAGLNPYVFKKSQNFARNFSFEELRNISSRLVYIYHEARRGNHEFETELERFVLGM